MPKKRCCCDVEPEPEDYGLCCRPIASHCVGKTYRFAYQFKAKYPCLTTSFQDVLYNCPNGSNVQVLGEPEEWLLSIEYTINEPAKVRGRYGPLTSGTLRYNWVDSTGSQCPSGPFPQQYDAKEGPYADCRSDVDLSRCYPFGINQNPIPWPPATNTGLRFNGCYDSYQIKNPNETCTTEGTQNLINVSSYSFQFLPSPQQQQSNYTPKLTPNLLKFELACQAFQDPFISLPLDGYDILLDIGIGLNTTANCGQNVIPIIIPYSESIDDFFGGLIYNGIFITSRFNREILGTDAMDICFPKTTRLYPATDFVNTFPCIRNTNIKFKDSYRKFSLDWYFGYADGLGPPGYDILFGTSNYPIPCEVGFEPSMQSSWTSMCVYFGFNYEIEVTEV